MTADRLITVDDLRHKAEKVRDAAKEEALQALHQDVTTYVIVGVVVFAVALSLAYRMGAKASSRRR
jgi:hypothetical protein